jgi:hypothetical protein
MTLVGRARLHSLTLERRTLQASRMLNVTNEELTRDPIIYTFPHFPVSSSRRDELSRQDRGHNQDLYTSYRLEHPEAVLPRDSMSLSPKSR